MSSPLTPIAQPAMITAGAAVAAPGTAPGFASTLADAIARVDQSNQAAQGSIDRYLSGENEEVHDVVMSIQRNELQFDLFLQVRNKVVQAYQEVMRMQM